MRTSYATGRFFVFVFCCFFIFDFCYRYTGTRLTRSISYIQTHNASMRFPSVVNLSTSLSSEFLISSVDDLKELDCAYFDLQEFSTFWKLSQPLFKIKLIQCSTFSANTFGGAIPDLSVLISFRTKMNFYSM